MANIGTTNSNLIGTANSLLEARKIARENQGNEKIIIQKDGTYSVEKIDEKTTNEVNQKNSSKFDPSIVEFSIQKNGENKEITNSNTTLMNRARIASTDAEELLMQGVNYIENKTNQAINYAKNIVLSEVTPKPTDGTVIESKPSSQIIEDLKSGKTKLPIYIKITNKDNGDISYFKLTQEVINSLKELEFPKEAQAKYGFSTKQDTRDGTITKGYGCTDVSLHKYLVPGKTAKAEKAAESVLIYQAITHAQERFDTIPKIFMDNFTEQQKTALISSGFNMSSGMFVGGTKNNPNADNPNGFKPVKMMKDFWNELSQGDGNVSMQDLKDAINASFATFVSGFREGQSGLQSRRAFDFIIAMGGKPPVSSPYGNEDKLVKTLKDMYSSELDPPKKAAIGSVLDVLKSFPNWNKYFK